MDINLEQRPGVCGAHGHRQSLLRTAGRQFLTAFCFPSTGYCLPLSALCLLLSAFCLLPSAFCSPPAARAQKAEPAPTEKPATRPSQIDPKAREILDRAIPSLGGQAFLQARSISTRGRMFAISEGVTSGFAPFKSTVAFPDKRRFAYGKDKPVTLINDGERGWQLDRYGTVRQSPEQVRRWRIGSRYGYENLLRQVISEGGVLIQDAGRDFTDNSVARVVEITDAQQVHLRLYLHAVNYRPVRVAYRALNPESREWEEFAEVYADYRAFQDVDTPMHITRYLDGERYSEIFRNSVEYNAEISPSDFAPGS